MTAPVEVPRPYSASAPAANGTDVVEVRARSTGPRNPNGPNTNSGRAGFRIRRSKARGPGAVPTAMAPTSSP